jgi:lipoprotein NlpD
LRHTRSLYIAALCCLLLSACAETRGELQEGYVVRPQDTLYSIAWRYGLDYHDLARWNRIGPDFRIAVGQTLTLAPRNDVQRSAVQRRTPPAAVAPPRAMPGGSALPWVWPTDRLSAPQAVAGGGVLLAGRLGQDIRAASAGRVVYNGTGIRGYGNLIIIKHGENLLSAYAHNRESLVREGQEVTPGQVIGHMGEGAPQKPVLYFEIRRNGKPVNPLGLLPKAM